MNHYPTSTIIILKCIHIKLVLVLLQKHPRTQSERRDEHREGLLPNAKTHAQCRRNRICLEIERQKHAIASFLRLLGRHAHVIAVQRRRVNLLLRLRKTIDFLVQGRLKQSMDDDVGIPPNRAREVRVVRNVQREVTPIHLVELAGGQVLRGTHGRHEGFRDALHYERVVALPAKTTQRFLQRLRIGGVDVEVEALPGHVHDLLHSLFDGGVVISQQRPSGSVCDKTLRHEVVRHQHELFDEAVRVPDGVGGAELGRLSVLLQLKCELDAVER
mmetsp:Transcript_29221/g.53558  ORF Transcript_29221/g.53558 Transcript_29221/m.53558 type:complete len:273 (+) Transcript_29221:603-1421(+)